MQIVVEMSMSIIDSAPRQKHTEHESIVRENGRNF